MTGPEGADHLHALVHAASLLDRRPLAVSAFWMITSLCRCPRTFATKRRASRHPWCAWHGPEACSGDGNAAPPPTGHVSTSTPPTPAQRQGFASRRKPHTLRSWRVEPPACAQDGVLGARRSRRARKPRLVQRGRRPPFCLLDCRRRSPSRHAESDCAAHRGAYRGSLAGADARLNAAAAGHC